MLISKKRLHKLIRMGFVRGIYAGQISGRENELQDVLNHLDEVLRNLPGSKHKVFLATIVDELADRKHREQAD